AHLKAHVQRDIRQRAYTQADEDHQAVEVIPTGSEAARRRKGRGQRRGQGLERKRSLSIPLCHGAKARRHQREPCQGDIEQNICHAASRGAWRAARSFVFLLSYAFCGGVSIPSSV